MVLLEVLEGAPACGEILFGGSAWKAL